MGREDNGAHDEQLIARIVTGEVAAFEALYDRHADVVFPFLLRVVGDRGVAENLLQEAFVRVWQNAASFDADRGQVRSWLFGIAHHLALQELRRQRRRPVEQSASGVDPRDETASWVADPAPDPVDMAWSAVRDAGLVNAMDQLQPEHRQVVELYAIGYSQSEIATLTERPLGTVKTWMRRSLHRLRQILESEGLDTR